MADNAPARFMDLREISSDWRLNCSVHGDVTMVIVFNNDIKNRSFCQACWEQDVVRASKKLTFRTNGGPEPEVISAARA